MKTTLLCLLFIAATTAVAEIKLETIEYKQGDIECEGFIAYEDALAGPRPGVLVVHDWMGNGEFSKKKAEQLAQLGYIAFAADIYGKGVRPKNVQEAAQQAGHYKNDRALLRARVNAAMKTFKGMSKVDPSRIAAIGFCFGGTTALELARSGADIVGVVSFHGGLSTPTPEDAKNIKGKILALHGADDPFVKDDEVAAFQKEMRDAKVDWQFVSYGNAVHGFTNPAAGTDNSKGAAYNEKADRRSWVAMKDFFAEVFAK
jgi:dienelactone hydrolase